MIFKRDTSSTEDNLRHEDPISFYVDFLIVEQPIGDFYIASIPAKKLVDITDFDVRRVLIEDRDVERYLGIQRPLNKNRVNEISNYVRTKDACFPTAVIIAISAKCVEIDEDKKIMKISNYLDTDIEDDKVYFKNIARVLDGQHRLAGLKNFDNTFDVNVSIFVDADIADQAIIFSTVNLAQTKVSKSLAYDLFDLMKTRSPQKTCHNIAVTLDREPDSPLFKMIKRLGVATPGRTGETLTQATFIEPLLNMITENPMRDRDIYLRKSEPKKLLPDKLKKHPFQHMFVDQKDFEIIDILWNYFSVVKDIWGDAWNSRDRGVMLNRTNGYRALMRYLVALYRSEFKPGCVPSVEDFSRIFSSIEISSSDFNVDTFAAGTSGESKLYRSLVARKIVE